MRRAGIRFTPPHLARELAVPLAWILSRAFGPPPAPTTQPVPLPAPETAVRLARRLGVSARIAARNDRARLVAELGEPAAALQSDLRQNAAENLRLGAALGAVAAASAQAGIPIAFLKYAALDLSGFLSRSGRSASDLDVLAPEGREGELSGALADAGFAISRTPGYEHQLPPQIHPQLGALEVHRIVLGVRPNRETGDRRSATLETLLASGLLRRVDTLPGVVYLPVPDILAAHAIVHGIGQHGFEPSAYPALRTFADLLDLGVNGDSGAVRRLRLAGWLAEDVAEEELEAVADLCAGLGSGNVQAVMAGDGPSSRLLRHALAGRLDTDYESALKLSLLAPRPTERSPLGRKGAALVAALFPPADQLDAIYGPPSGPLGRFGRRLYRPLDLLARAARSAGRSRRLGRVDRSDR